MKPDIAIYNALILTVNALFDIIESGLILIKGDEIISVSSWCGGVPDAFETINANGGIVMPGLINAHTHLPMTLFRALADDLSLDDWLNRFIMPAEKKCLNEKNIAVGCTLALAEMINSGTTTICDAYFLEKEIAKTVSVLGVRAVLGQGVIDFPAPGVEDPKDNIRNAVSFVEEWKNRNPLITPSICCHAPYTCSNETIVSAKTACERLGVKFQIHVSETRHEVENSIEMHNMTPVARLDHIGVLDENSLLAHLVWVDGKDMEILKKRNVAGVHCPMSNMKLASGIAPMEEMLKKNILMGLGTDGAASNNRLDMFQEMDAAAKISKASTLNPEALSAVSAIRMATISGARALGLEKQTGSIEAGKKADLIVIDTNRPHLTPLYNPASAVVYSATGADVRDVMVGGRFLKRNFTLVTIDMNGLIEKGRQIGNGVQRAIGLTDPPKSTVAEQK